MCNSNGTGKPFTPTKKNTWFPHKGLGGYDRRNFVEVLVMCVYPKKGGGPRSKKATLRHYQKQNKRGGFLFNSTGWNTLVLDGPVSWFRWVFLDLDHHADDCKWVRFSKAVTFRR